MLRTDRHRTTSPRPALAHVEYDDGRVAIFESEPDTGETWIRSDTAVSLSDGGGR